MHRIVFWFFFQHFLVLLRNSFDSFSFPSIVHPRSMFSPQHFLFLLIHPFPYFFFSCCNCLFFRSWFSCLWLSWNQLWQLESVNAAIYFWVGPRSEVLTVVLATPEQRVVKIGEISETLQLTWVHHQHNRYQGRSRLLHMHRERSHYSSPCHLLPQHNIFLGLEIRS